MKLISAFFALLLCLTLARADYVGDTIKLINAERTKAGLGTIQADPALNSIAQTWAEKLAGKQALEHRSISNLKEVMGKYGLHHLNENLHCSTSPASPNVVIDAWMHSPHHHDNLLRSSITRGGIGVQESGNGMTYVVFNGAF